jgi:acetyl esterase/lipase
MVRLLFTGLITFAGVLSCQSPQPQHPDPVLFERWFTATACEVPPGILGTPAPVLDSMCSALRKQSPAGQFRTVLADTSGISYTIGYQTPLKVRNDTTYPCVIYLHGGTGTTLSDKGDSAYKMLAMLADSMDLFLVSPSANRYAFWWSASGLSRILQTLRYMTLHYPINPDKVFLAGVSDGATGCWAAANTIAAPFAGFIAISGFGGMLPQLGMEMHPENLMQRPIYNVNAGNDRIYPIAAVNMFLDRMERAGVGVKRTVYQDEEHGFDYRLKEAGTLCTLVRAWSIPRSGGVCWSSAAGYPVNIDHCIAVKRTENAESFSLRGFCRNDTFFLRTSGLARLQMYFDTDDRCVQKAIFSINDKTSRKYEFAVSDRKMELLLMKQRCFPVITSGLFFSIPL